VDAAGQKTVKSRVIDPLRRARRDERRFFKPVFAEQAAQFVDVPA
jgi:hypothetical protein